MPLIGDFVAGAGAVGAQMSMDALKSTIEEERAARLAEMQNKFQTARDERQNAFQSGENKLGRDLTVSENAATRAQQTALAERGEAAADKRLGRQLEHAENQQVNALAHAEYLSDQTRALQERQLGISAGHLALARDQAAMGKQIIGEDGRIAFVTPDGKGGAKVSGYLKTPDGKDFVAPKNISEAAKLEYSAISERIKALDKVAADSMNPDGAARARAEIMTLTDQQRNILTGGKPAQPGAAPAAVKDPFAPKGDKAGDAKFEDMKKAGEKAGPMNAPSAKAPVTGDDPEPPKFKNRGQVSAEWEAWKERQDEKAAKARGAEIRAVRGLINP